MRNEMSFGSRVAANWCALVEHMNTLSELTENDNPGAAPRLPSATVDDRSEEGASDEGW